MVTPSLAVAETWVQRGAIKPKPIATTTDDIATLFQF